MPDLGRDPERYSVLGNRLRRVQGYKETPTALRRKTDCARREIDAAGSTLRTFWWEGSDLPAPIYTYIYKHIANIYIYIYTNIACERLAEHFAYA